MDYDLRGDDVMEAQVVMMAAPTDASGVGDSD
jgi:hypothetical protein